MPRYKSDGVGALDIVAENINSLDARASKLCEIRRAHINELAYELFHMSGYDENDENLLDMQWLQNIKEAYLQIREGETCETIGENRAALARFFDTIDNSELAELSLAIKKLILERDDNPPVSQFFVEYGESISPSASDKIACIKNYYTDTAYARFSACLQKPSALYYDSFATLCEEVSSGKCEYCILPIENSDDGKLMSFYKLLALHELKIVLTTSVSLPDDSKSTSLALVRKGIEHVRRISRDTAGRYFEFCLVPSENINILDICAAAEFFGMKVHRIDCATLAYSENEFEYYVVLETDDADLYSFLIYMSLKAPHYNATGIYTQIK